MCLNLTLIQRVFIIISSLLLTGCGQQQTALPKNHHLNCILMGSDSLIFYYGDGQQMEQVKTGNIRDSLFMKGVFRTIKSLPADTSFKIRIKPTASGDLEENFTTLVDMLNDHDVQGRSIDTLFPLEQRTFFITSPSELLDSKKDPVHPFRLIPDAPSSPDDPATPNTFTLFFSADNVLYGFMGSNMHLGKTYTAESLTRFLLANKGSANFIVRLRASVKSSYKIAVDMLDMMQQNGIEKYNLEDMTKAQERFLNIKMQEQQQ